MEYDVEANAYTFDSLNGKLGSNVGKKLIINVAIIDKIIKLSFSEALYFVSFANKINQWVNVSTNTSDTILELSFENITNSFQW